MKSARSKTVRRTLADGTVRTYVYPAPGARAEDPPAIRHLATQWRSSPEWARLAPATKENYLLRLNTLEDRLGYLRLSEIDDRSVKADFYRVRDGLAARPATADATLAALSAMLTWAVRRALIDVNRARDIPKLDAKNKRAGIVLEAADEPRLLAACAPDYRRLVAAALLTGLRLGDLLSLTRGHVGADGWLTVTPAKTRRWGIVVALPPDVVARFAAPGQVLLPREDGQPWSDAGADLRWRLARAAAGLDHLHFHDLRGTLATRLYDAGCSDAEANAVLGKTIARGSMNAYVQRTRTMTINAYAKLFRVVDFRPEKKTGKRRS